MNYKKRPESGGKLALRARGYLPVAEASQRLGCSTQTIRNWAANGQIILMRFGRSQWVEWSALVRYFQVLNPDTAKLIGILP